MGQLLVAEGFSSIDDIKDSDPESLMKIEGIEEETRYCPNHGKDKVLLKLRRNRWGKAFYGCTQYPKCKHAENP